MGRYAWQPAAIEGDQLMRFNVVVANPPFSLDKWGAEDAANDRYKRFWRGVPPKSKGDYAFIYAHDRDDLPRAGTERARGRDRAAWGAVPGRQRRADPPAVDRREPAGCGDRPAGQPVLRDRHPGGDPDLQAQQKPTTRCCSSTPAASSSRARTRTDCAKQDLDKILATYKARATVDKYAYLAEPEEIEENDFNLNIPRYVDTFEPEPPVDMDAVNAEINLLKEELDRCGKKDAELFARIGVLDDFEVETQLPEVIRCASRWK